MITLTAIGRSLSSGRLLWLDFVILSMEELLNALHTIRVAGCVDPATVGSDASAAAAPARGIGPVVVEGENGLIHLEARAN